MFLQIFSQLCTHCKYFEVFSTAFGNVISATVIWLYMPRPKIAIDLKLYSSVSLNITCTVVGCDNHPNYNGTRNTANDCKLAVDVCSVVII